MKKIRSIFSFMLALTISALLCACGAADSPAGEAPTSESLPTESDAAQSDFAADDAAAYYAAAYDAAAQAVEQEFIRLIEDGLEDFDESAHPELPWYTAMLCRYPENRYYKAFYDFDGNGTPELLIGVGDGKSCTPIALYAFDGEQMRYLCKDAPLGERAFLSRADGLFIVRASGGADRGALTLYRIAADGWSTEIVDVIDYRFLDAEHVSYTSEMGVVVSEELLSRGLTDAVGLDVEPEWSCFWCGNEKP